PKTGAGAIGPQETAALPASVFLTFKNGLSTVIEALEQRIRTEGGTIRTGANVRAIEPLNAEGDAAYRLRLADGSACEADQVIVTLPAYAAADLLASHTDVSALSAIRYVSVANVVFGYEAEG